MTTTITKEDRERIKMVDAHEAEVERIAGCEQPGRRREPGRLLDALEFTEARAESAEHRLRYLSTLVLGHSEGTAEEIGAAIKQALSEAYIDGSRDMVDAARRAEAAEAREAVLREALTNARAFTVPGVGRGPGNSQWAEMDEGVSRALASDGSPMLERVRALEADLAMERRERAEEATSMREAWESERKRADEAEARDSATMAAWGGCKGHDKALEAEVATLKDVEALRARLEALRQKKARGDLTIEDVDAGEPPLL